MACNGRSFALQCSRTRREPAGTTALYGWAMRRRRAPPNISSRKNSRAAELDRRTSRRRPFAPSSTIGLSKRATIPPDAGIERLRVSAGDRNFAYTLDLTATGPLVLQGEGGYSRKSEAGQASYYYSQPFFTAEGSVSLNGREMKVAGRAWMDREWSSQPLGPDQKGWDWFSLHLARRRETDAVSPAQRRRPHHFCSAIGSRRAAQRRRSRAKDIASSL